MWPANTPQSRIPTRTTRLPIASRCRMKRRRAYAHWLRAFSSRPDSNASSDSVMSAGTPSPSAVTPGWTSGVPVGTTPWSTWTRGSGSWRCVSVKANAWVEEAEHEVGQQIEEDDHGRGHHQPGHDHVRLAAA